MNNKALHIKQNKKWLSVLLTICMVITLIPATVMADTAKAPLSYKMDDPAAAVSADPADTTYFTNVEDAAKYVREQFAERASDIYVPYDLSYGDKDLNTVFNEIYQAVFEETGVGNEGDYNRYHYGGIQYGVDPGDGTNRYILRYSFSYYTTKEQEEELAGKISQVLDSLKLKGKSDYDKFIAIYDYIVENVDYDDRHLKDDSYKLKYTAYAAMCNGTAVCQGYANLLYRMLWEAGVPNRIIAGDTPRGGHAWNIVKIGDYYYNVDATWDSGYIMTYTTNSGTAEIRHTMNWRLRCDENFPDHSPESRFTEASFISQHPKSTTDYANPSFMGHAISLSDEIGVKFYVYVPTGTDMTGAYMDFVISDGRKISVDLSEAQDKMSSLSAYVFTCPINALEVADDITATLHFGENGTSTTKDTYSAQSYCQYIIKYSDKYQASVVSLASAIMNYGYYMQQQQSLPDGWTDKKTNHNPITCANAYAADGSDLSRVASETSQYAFVYPTGIRNLERVAYSMTLNSKTKINLYFKFSSVPSGFPIDAFSEVTINGDTWYQYTITGITPISYKAQSDITGAEICTLSYVDAVLNGNFPEAKKYAMVAYYDYCDAAYTYWQTTK